MKRNSELDLLRFLACAAVVVYHLAYSTALKPLVQFGYLGVDLFFMISGYVILWSAEGRTARSFAIARFSRLYPCFWMCLVIAVIALSLQDKPPALAHVLANATMAAGFLDMPYVTDVYWTLLVELKFYVLVGALIVFRQIHNLESWLAGWLLVILAGRLVDLPSGIATLTIEPFAHLFIAGATCLLVSRSGMTWRRATTLLICAGLASVHAYKQSKGFMGYHSFGSPILSVGCMALLVAVSMRLVRLPSGMNIAPLAALTYPLYLIHSPVGYAVDDYIGVIGAIALSAAIAYAVVRIDQPVSAAAKNWLTAVTSPLPSREQLAIAIRRKT